jgi:DNA-binding MarR family transcriptional regulator
MELFQMPGHLIRRLHQQSTHIFLLRTQLAGYDITPVQFAALEAIHAHPEADQAHVAERIGYDRATIGGVIDRMEKKKWVKRVVSARDRRSRELSLSADGERTRIALLPIVRDIQEEILLPLTPQHRATFLQMTRDLVASQQTLA